MSNIFDSIESALQDIRDGKMVIVVDDESRENEGDFVMAAEKVTPEAINFMATHGKGIICTPITAKRAHELQLDFMVKGNTSTYGTPFTVSIDLIEGNSTGISCSDRARTIQALTNPQTRPQDFMRPGHVFPLIAQDRGVLTREGHTEAAVDLARLCGLSPAGVICEIMSPDGTMSRVPELKELALRFQMKLITIKDLINYIQKNTPTVRSTGQIEFPTDFGRFQLYLFEEVHPPYSHHVAIVKGQLQSSAEPILVRVHSECFTGDIFGSLRCDCGQQLKRALLKIEEKGQGVVLYLRQEGRGIGLPNKIRAYQLQDQGLDTVAANHALGLETDLRDYRVGVEILKHLGVQKIKLLTNNPQKLEELASHDLEIVGRIPIEIEANETNLHYLTTKRDKMGHLILGKTERPLKQ